MMMTTMMTTMMATIRLLAKLISGIINKSKEVKEEKQINCRLFLECNFWWMRRVKINLKTKLFTILQLQIVKGAF